ncbi:hypothetical protein [Prosthecomicrobium sp. N25]|uniref:hypothetical protein n=1 Tax=Prosthecomicrobium sp. N25 TaxID=3129254 RepID=UPI0030788237
MITGRQALASMEQAIAEQRSNEGRLDAVLASATEEAQRLRHEQTEAWRALARLRLDDLAGTEVAGRLDATERRALQLLETARAALADLSARRAEAAARVSEQEAALRAATEAADAIDDEIDALTARTAEAGRQDAEWSAGRARIEEAERIAAESEKKATTAEEDRRVKGAPYEADPLFMYLWKRGFGTAAYQAGTFARFFDRKVAALVGYAEARPNYVMLNEIPVRLREHAERRRHEVEAAQQDLAAVERRLLETSGIAPLEARRAAAQADIDKAQASLKLARDHLAAVEQEHQLALEGNGKGGYAEALDMLAAELAREDLQDLYRAAVKTPDPRDERIVRQLQGLEEAIAKADREIQQIRAQARDLANRRVELEGVRDDFRRQGYDHPQVTFGNERIIGEMIGGIIGGVLRSPDLWRVLRDGYGRRPRRADPGYGGGPRFPLPGPFDGGFGGGFGGGGSSGGGGGGGGGGFRTGGGF